MYCTTLTKKYVTFLPVSHTCPNDGMDNATGIKCAEFFLKEEERHRALKKPVLLLDFFLNF
jgi:hypothetical protein